METISFSCPQCNFQMSAETIYCGQLVRCAQCNSEVQIPQKQETPNTPVEMPDPDVKKVVAEKNFSMLTILMWILVGLQLGCFILLLCISLNTKSSPSAYEYKTLTFERYYKQDFANKLQELGKEGWEYIGALNGNETLLRRVKTRPTSVDKK